MTTKRELREALQRLLDATPRLERGNAWHEARALLARPAVVVGYVWRAEDGSSPVRWRPNASTGRTLDDCRELAHEECEEYGGTVRKLVVR